MRSMKLAAFLGLALLAACSEGPLPTDDVAATQFIGEVSASFQAVQPMLHRSLAIEQQGDGFKPIVPAQLERIAPGRWRKPGPHKLDVEWPKEANGVMRLSSGPVTIEVRPVGARAVAGAAVERALVYRDNYQGASSFHVAEVDRVEEFIVLRDETTPRVFEWDVSVVRGGGRVRQNAGVVEVLDGKGVAWLRLERPWMVDGAGEKRKVEAVLSEGRLRLSVPEQVKSFPVLLDPGWTATGSMVEPRRGHTATLLPSGKVLVAGGRMYLAESHSSAELFDPSTGTWTTTGTMAEPRIYHTATLLPSGNVLVAGGSEKSNAELYIPSSGSWTTTGSMAAVRSRHTATLLSSGQVLVAGNWLYLTASSAELYDPSTGSWTTTGSMTEARENHTATLL